MTSQNVPPSGSSFSPEDAPSARRWALPEKKVPVVSSFGLTYGLHIMVAPKAAGKTLTALAIAVKAKAEGVRTVFAYIMEPRAHDVTSLLEMGAWQAYLQACLNNASEGLLILDSLTYVLHRLDIIRELEESIGRVTYAGGLTPRDILSILVLDDMARKNKVAVIGTLNSELFPVAEKLEGACEGAIKLLAPGSFLLRTRRTRESVSLSVDVSEAAKMLGYSKRPTLEGEIV